MEFLQVAVPAPADTVLGRLQRGRGAGWLETAGSDTGRQILVECLASEPRIDRQMEPRADYYATLAQHLGVAPSSFSPYPCEGTEPTIATGVVEAMARRGSQEAIEILREARRGERPVDEKIADDVVSSGGTSVGRGWEWRDLPIEELLAEDWSRRSFPRAVVHRLRTSTLRSEVETLRETALDPSHTGWCLATYILARRADPTPLPAVEEVLLANCHGSIRVAAFRYVLTLSREMALPLARDWLGYADDGRGAVAASVMAKHAASEDTDSILAALARSRDYYSMSSLPSARTRLDIE